MSWKESKTDQMWLGFKCKKVRRKLWLWIYIWTRKGETDVHYSLLSVSWSKLPIGTDYKVRTLYSNCLLQWFVCVSYVYVFCASEHSGISFSILKVVSTVNVPLDTYWTIYFLSRMVRFWRIDEDYPVQVASLSNGLCCAFSTDGSVLAAG